MHPDVPIDVLLTDAEGYDFEVLLGAQQNVLPRTSYLEFELSPDGKWTESLLSAAIELLRHHGFLCYWPTKQAKLFHITDCWLDHYDDSVWGNVACVKSTQVALAKSMEENFLRSMAELAAK